jgi:hypothetical protein
MMELGHYTGFGQEIATTLLGRIRLECFYGDCKPFICCIHPQFALAHIAKFALECKWHYYGDIQIDKTAMKGDLEQVGQEKLAIRLWG